MILNNRIHFRDFMTILKSTEIQYPDAEVLSVGSGCIDGEWVYIIYLKSDNNEIKCTVPCYDDQL